jgi:YVTN family beta-propeller protein
MIDVHRPGDHRIRRTALGLAGVLAAGALLVASGPALASSGGAPHKVPLLVFHAPSSDGFNAPDAAAVVGGDLFVANSGGNTITEVDATSGAFVAQVSGSTFRLSDPTAMVAAGGDLFVANGTGNSVTEIDAGTRSLVRVISASSYKFSHPVSLAAQNGDLFVLSAGGTGSVGAAVTKLSVSSGALEGVATGTAYGFSTPTAVTVAGGHVYAVDNGSNAVTVLDRTTLAFVRKISGAKFQFNRPTGAGVLGAHLFVTDTGNDSVTEIVAKSDTLVRVITSDENYLPTPGPITTGDGYVFVDSPPGSSPMITQVVPKTGNATWMMCNTNGPYDFNNPEALAVAGTTLWVVSEGGNSLTEMNASTGALIRTVS